MCVCEPRPCVASPAMVSLREQGRNNGGPMRIMNRRLTFAGLGLALIALNLTTLAAHAQSARHRDTVQVGIIDRTFFFQPVVVAIQNGYFADEGLIANIRFIRSGEGQADGLLKGDLHFALSSVEGILQNAERGGPLRLLAANSGKLSHFIIAQKKFKAIEDLKGATVGILTLTEGSFFNWQEIAAKHGLKYPEDYKVMQTTGASARHHLLLEGRIDVGLQSIPWAFVAEDAGFSNLGSASEYVPEWQFTTYNVNGDWAKANARKVEGFLRAILRATDWIYRNGPQASEIAAREMNIKVSYAERAWEYYTQTGTLTRDLALSEPGLRKVFDAQVKAGLLLATATFDPKKYIAAGYLERARAAVKKYRD